MRFPRGPRHCDRGRARRDPTGGERSASGRSRLREGAVRGRSGSQETCPRNIASQRLLRGSGSRGCLRLRAGAPLLFDGRAEPNGTEVFHGFSCRPCPVVVCRSFSLPASRPASSRKRRPPPAVAKFAADVVVSAEAAPEPDGDARRRRDRDRRGRDRAHEGDDAARSPAHRARPRRRPVGRARRRHVALPPRHDLHADARPRGRRAAQQPLLRRHRPLGRVDRERRARSRSCAGPFSALYGSEAIGGVVQSLHAQGRRGGRLAGAPRLAFGNAVGDGGSREKSRFSEGALSGTVRVPADAFVGRPAERVLRRHDALGRR